MIHESQYWKEELFRSGNALPRFLTMKRFSDRSLGRFEKLVMVSMYSIRKLHESGKIPLATVQQTKKLQCYLASSDRAPSLVKVSADKLYDFESPRWVSRDLLFIVNQIIHSSYFVPVTNEKGTVDSILVNSDRTKDKFILRISLRFVISLILHFSSGDITLTHSRIVDGRIETIETVYRSDLELELADDNPVDGVL